MYVLSTKGTSDIVMQCNASNKNEAYDKLKYIAGEISGCTMEEFYQRFSIAEAGVLKLNSHIVP